MPSPESRLTIALPTFNRSEYLQSCLDNIAAQTHRDYHVLILDNASTDATADIASKFCAKDPRFRHLRQPEHIPGLINFADGLRRAGSPLFMWRADDDLWAPDYLEKLIATRDASPHCRLVAARTIQQRIDGAEREIRGEIPFPQVGTGDIARMRLLLKSTPSWVYGIYDHDVLLPVLEQALAEYVEPWACDQLVLFYFGLNGLIAGTNDTTFTMQRFEKKDAPVSATHQYKKGDTITEKLDFEVMLRERFYRIGSQWIDKAISNPVRAATWRLFLLHFMARKIMPARTIWRRRVRQAIRTAFGKS